MPSAIVLPFESKYVDSDDQQFVFVPGSAYFIDSALNLITDKNNKKSLNSKPYLDYVNIFNSHVSVARMAVENLFDIDNPANNLRLSNINDTLLQIVKASISGLADDNL